MAVTPISKETELAPFVYDTLTKMGHDYRSELHHIDIVSRDGMGDYMGVELKKTFNVDVIYQAVRTQKWTGWSVIVVPLYGKSAIKREKQKRWLRICKAMKIGLWLVEEDNSSPDTGEASQHVIRILYAGERIGPGTLKKAITKEFNGRQKDMNTGGCTRTSLFTAFLEKYSKVARYHIDEAIKNQGIHGLKASSVKDGSGVSDAGRMMYANVNNWFSKRGTGYYELNIGVLKYLDVIAQITGPFDIDRITELLKKTEAYAILHEN